ncbi:MAG: hypothetical protein JKY65_16375 [Planctomycetes bacterium]|nr:hypothetical protein [Planctomycetota bacterium]
MSEKAVFPPADFVRRGPPAGVRDIDRRKREKWSRVVVVAPRAEDTPERTRYDFVTKGPFTLPLAVLRDDVDAGDKHAWLFFTHPYSVFPEDACFFNVGGRGCLGSRLFVRSPEGVRIYDEVGANLAKSEFVSETYQGALGVLRDRVLGPGVDRALDSHLLPDLLELDVDMLELFYLATTLLRTDNPAKALERIYLMVRRPTLRSFAWDLFDDGEQDLLRKLKAGEVSIEKVGARFQIRKEDLVQVTDVRGPNGRQIVAEMISEWRSFEATHEKQMGEIARGIAEQEQRLVEIKGQVREVAELKREAEGKKGISGMFSRAGLFGKSPTQRFNELKAEAVKSLRAKRELEQAFDEIPGYDKVRGLTDRVQGFQDSVETIHAMAYNLVDHNVTRAQLNGLRKLIGDIRPADDVDASRRALRTYTLRLRAEILPRILATHSMSAYVLRRPDALLHGSRSFRNMARSNALARRMIEYFRFMPYGSQQLGEAFDEGWGQVIQLEERI